MKLSLSTLLQFLCFSSDAIKAIAHNKSATWVGLLFVIAAGFAREYDGEYLVAEPWHVLLPIAASLIGCLFMVVLVYLNSLWTKGRRKSFFDTFRCFLNVYSMTAPLALVYALPVERMMNAGNATLANLVLLGIVAVWRVALMVRCVQVLYNVHWARALMPVMLFSDILAMTAIALVPGPIFMIMGGVRLTESEATILAVRIWLGLLGYGSLLIWFFGYVGQAFSKRPWDFFKSRSQFEDHRGVSVTLWLATLFCLVVWIPFLPATQAEQKLRWQSEKMIMAGDIDAFSRLTQDHPESAFPPHWDPPPRIGYGEYEPEVESLLISLVEKETADWMVEKYFDKIKARNYWAANHVLDSLSKSELKAFVALLENHPDSRELANVYRIINLEDWRDRDPEMQQLIARILELSGKVITPLQPENESVD